MQSEIVAGVRAFAEKHYEKDGWDVVVECFSDEDIERIVGKATTVRGAIWKVRQDVSVYDEHRRDIEGTAF